MGLKTPILQTTVMEPLRGLHRTNSEQDAYPYGHTLAAPGRER